MYLDDRNGQVETFHHVQHLPLPSSTVHLHRRTVQHCQQSRHDQSNQTQSRLLFQIHDVDVPESREFCHRDTFDREHVRQSHYHCQGMEPPSCHHLHRRDNYRHDKRRIEMDRESGMDRPIGRLYGVWLLTSSTIHYL